MDDRYSFEQHLGEGSRHKRDMPRDSMFLQAPVRNLSEDHAAVLRVRNLSAGGMMADPSSGFAVGHRVEIELRHIGAVTGTVAWVAEDRLGIAFDQRIDPKLARKPIGKAAAQPGSVPVAPLAARRPGLKLDKR